MICHGFAYWIFIRRERRGIIGRSRDINGHTLWFELLRKRKRGGKGKESWRERERERERESRIRRWRKGGWE